MKKLNLCIFVMSFALLLIGCDFASVEKGEHKSIVVERDVMFMNEDPKFVTSIMKFEFNELYSLYEEDEDAEMLYAFRIHKGHLRKNEEAYPTDFPVRGDEESDDEYELRAWSYVRNMIEKHLLEKGFYLLQNSPEESIIFAGTLEEVEKAFDKTSSLVGWYMDVESVAHPEADIMNAEDMQIMKKVSLIVYE